MSFSSDVKKEIGNVQADSCCLKSELYSIIRYKSKLKLSSTGLGFTISTTLNVVARRIVYLFKLVYNQDLEIEVVKRNKLDFKDKFVLNFNHDASSILIDLKILNPDYSINEQINYDIIKKPCCKGALLRGLFLVQGSINDPATSNYHLEIILDDKEDYKLLNDILLEVGIDSKLQVRKKGYILYIKKSEMIGDFLKFIGANNSLFYFENQRIMRDYNNSVNRIINCDISNEERVIRTSKEQLANIEYLSKTKGIVNLPDRIVNAIVLRTTYPDYSLGELSDESQALVGKYISKSGLSHCFKDIEKMVNDLKGIN